jgi:RND superfamily putative drug exporter
MIGIAVAIDYSLFVLARYRREIARGGTPDEARRTAMATSGVAVVFSGLTVLVALLSLLIVDSTVLRSIALGGVVVIAFSVLSAVTLLPALIALFGHRAYEPGRVAAITARLRRLVTRREPGQGDFWGRWTHAVMRRPIISLIGVSAVMVALALPALSAELDTRAEAQFPGEHDATIGMALAEREIGPGALAPVRSVATFREGRADAPAAQRAIDAYIARLETDKAIDVVLAPKVSDDKRSIAFDVVPSVRPESNAGVDLIERLRADAQKGTGLAAMADLHFGGEAALSHDFADLIGDSLPEVFLVLMALTYLLMLVLLRSAILPLKAVLMNLLTVGAACGVVVALFQWGWLSGVLGFEETGYVEAMIPPLILAVVFGLSMDYEVLILSRIREARATSRDDREAVATGLRATAGTVSSAALIMVSVFLAFAAVSVPSIRQLGVGLAVAVALDATLVRLVLVPATMTLLGRWNWWLPRALGPLVPRVNVESGPTSGRSG